LTGGQEGEEANLKAGNRKPEKSASRTGYWHTGASRTGNQPLWQKAEVSGKAEQPVKKAPGEGTGAYKTLRIGPNLQAAFPNAA
jgi:hypothetical protein